MEKKQEERREQEIVYSRSVKAGKRIYYLDVRKARNADLYLSITESKQLGYRFRRQQIIDNYIVDFVCLEKTLIIEIDGKYHNTTEQQTYDQIREQKLLTQGFTTIRFTNEEITNDIDNTILCIKQHLQ